MDAKDHQAAAATIRGADAPAKARGRGRLDLTAPWGVETRWSFGCGFREVEAEGAATRAATPASWLAAWSDMTESWKDARNTVCNPFGAAVILVDRARGVDPSGGRAYPGTPLSSRSVGAGSPHWRRASGLSCSSFLTLSGCIQAQITCSYPQICQDVTTPCVLTCASRLVPTTTL